MIPLRDNIPTTRTPVVTYALIVANVLVYFLWRRGGLSLGDDTPTYVGLRGDLHARRHRPPRRGHVLPVDLRPQRRGALGRVKFVVFYLLGGVAAIALEFAIESGSQIATAGAASGAIAAVLGGYLLLYPRAKIVTVVFIVFFFTILELPALALLGFWLVEQALVGFFDLTQPGGGRVTLVADVGGFVFGLLAIRLFARGKRTQRPQERFARS